MCDLTITQVSYNYEATCDGRNVETVPYSAKNFGLAKCSFFSGDWNNLIFIDQCNFISV